MNNSERLSFLISEGALHPDSKIISTHNNLIVSSDLDMTVSRISTFEQIKARNDPGDLFYSHEMSRQIGRDGSVLAPVDDRPIVVGQNIISRYPKTPLPDWDLTTAEELTEAVHSLNSFSYEEIALPGGRDIRTLDVADYVRRRLDSFSKSEGEAFSTYVQKRLDEYNDNYPFWDTSAIRTGLVHGDMHAGNVVRSDEKLLFIDLDSVAIGPQEYDLASWCVRSMRGDSAPALESSRIAIEEGLVDKDRIRKMAGWKVLSSMSHELINSTTNSDDEILKLASIAQELEAPGNWRFYA